MKKHELLKSVGPETDIIIWGARMTGMGAHRFFRDHHKNVKCFVDSDPAFEGKRVGGVPVFCPGQLEEKILKHNWDPIIIIAVALKELEILKVIKELGLDKYKHLSFQSEEAPYFTVDILGSCNLACGSCPHSILDHGVPKGSMEFQTVKKVIDKIKLESPETTHISLYSWGEPLLHPRVSEIVKYVHEKGMAVALSSNLSFTFEKRLEQLVKSEPEYLKISVSGYYPEAYNATHQGGDINLVKSNLYRLRHFIDKHGSNILVDINYHLYRDNNGKNLNMFISLAKELGFLLSTTYALIMPLERVLKHLDGFPDIQTRALYDKMLVNIDEGIEISMKNVQSSNICPFRENQVNINADLTVPVCCTVFERGDNVVANNFLETSLAELEGNKQNVKICQTCMKKRLPEYNMGFNKDQWDRVAKSKSSLDLA